LHHAAAQETSLAADSTARFAHLDDLFARAASIEPAPVAPLIFRRETAFRSDLLGSSVPAWGTGLAPLESFGPFLDEHGLPVWFDFFFSVKSVKVYFKGQTTPVLLLPIWGSIVARKSYKIEPGSVWIAFSGLMPGMIFWAWTLLISTAEWVLSRSELTITLSTVPPLSEGAKVCAANGSAPMAVVINSTCFSVRRRDAVMKSPFESANSARAN